jgi:hypothetical protein
MRTIPVTATVPADLPRSALPAAGLRSGSLPAAACRCRLRCYVAEGCHIQTAFHLDLLCQPSNVAMDAELRRLDSACYFPRGAGTVCDRS